MDQAGYLRSHPPRCLAGFATRESELPGVVFDGHHENLNTVFLVSCECGHDRHYVLGHYWREPDGDTLASPDTYGTFAPSFVTKVHERARQIMMGRHNPSEPEPPSRLSRQTRDLVFLSPLAARCEACGRITELIDTNRHGYDAEIGALVATMRGEGDRVEHECKECGRKPLRLWARFEYSRDLFDRGIREFHGREQELFSWFSLVGHCSGCSSLILVADYECA
jgi:hypothetical protein